MIKKEELGLVVLRGFLGVTFLIHGFTKFQGGISNIVGFFESLGLPGFMAYVVALIELVGGIAMLLGFGTRIVAALFALILAVATIQVKFAVGFLGDGQMAGYELELALLVVSVYLALKSKSVWAIDNMIFRSKNV